MCVCVQKNDFTFDLQFELLAEGRTTRVDNLTDIAA